MWEGLLQYVVADILNKGLCVSKSHFHEMKWHASPLPPKEKKIQ